VIDVHLAIVPVEEAGEGRRVLDHRAGKTGCVDKYNMIRIAGTKRVDYPENVSAHRRERLWGVFDRTLTVPMQIDPDGIKAEYNDGVLALFIPRAERDKPRSINIS
jgi:HSP20 family molecular chaperone IbpA